MSNKCYPNNKGIYGKYRAGMPKAPRQVYKTKRPKKGSLLWALMKMFK